MELSNFHSEIDRGCQYFATALLPHRAGEAGFIVSPALEKTEVKYTKDEAIIRKYLVVPEFAFRDEIFDILEGEKGELIDIVLENKSRKKNNYSVLAYTIQWKGAFNLYYHNPATIQIGSRAIGINPTSNERIILRENKRIDLEELFSISKREPPRKNNK